MNDVAKIDQALDEMLVQPGGMVLRLSGPEVTRTAQKRRALALSVNQYAACAARSEDPRVQKLKAELEEALKPRQQLVVDRQATLADFQTTGTRRAAIAAGEITSISSGTRQRSVSRTRGSSLLAAAPSMTKPSKPLLMTSLHFCT